MSSEKKKILRRDFLLELKGFLNETDIVVAALAGTTYDCYANLDRTGNLYAAGLGMSTPIGFGLALALPKRRVIVLDTDGSLLLSPSILSVVAVYKPKNLSVICFDNERLYGSRGGPPSQTAHGADLAGIAKAAGIEKIATFEDLDSFRSKISWFLRKPGPAVIISKVKGKFDKGTGPTMNGQENKFKLVRFIEETEKIQILGAAK